MYVFSTGNMPRLVSEELKPLVENCEAFLKENGPFHVIVGTPSYSTVSRNVRDYGFYHTVIYYDGAMIQHISFVKVETL